MTRDEFSGSIDGPEYEDMFLVGIVGDTSSKPAQFMALFASKAGPQAFSREALIAPENFLTVSHQTSLDINAAIQSLSAAGHGLNQAPDMNSKWEEARAAYGSRQQELQYGRGGPTSSPA